MPIDDEQNKSGLARRLAPAFHGCSRWRRFGSSGILTVVLPPWSGGLNNANKLRRGRWTAFYEQDTAFTTDNA